METAILYSNIEISAVSKWIRDRNIEMKPQWLQNESETATFDARCESNDTRAGNCFLAWWHPPGNRWKELNRKWCSHNLKRLMTRLMRDHWLICADSTRRVNGEQSNTPTIVSKLGTEGSSAMEVDCVATGARPEPSFKWLIGGEEINVRLSLQPERSIASLTVDTYCCCSVSDMFFLLCGLLGAEVML